MNPIGRWFERRRLDRELAGEMSEHLAERVEQLMEQGQSEPEARANARRQFGNLTRQQEKSREAWGWNSFEQIAQDVRFAGRVLRKTPLLTGAAILTLTLGIGANAAIFTLIDKLLLRQKAHSRAPRFYSRGGDPARFWKCFRGRCSRDHDSIPGELRFAS
ncbi:MAG TPA: permease prefix domain 1-containing protein [Bryobacteraceae bacterium]|jgi:hypothetical protein|nr:permease prefix domain 1-containing protein [Bryobacteraceae bacterium]